jgi:hypothetical protein
MHGDGIDAEFDLTHCTPGVAETLDNCPKIGAARARPNPNSQTSTACDSRWTRRCRRRLQRPTRARIYRKAPYQPKFAAANSCARSRKMTPGFFPYLPGLSSRSAGGGPHEALATFVTNAAAAAIVNAVGPLRQFVRGATSDARRHPGVWLRPPRRSLECPCRCRLLHEPPPATRASRLRSVFPEPQFLIKASV